jgi:hypothetical protein
MEVYRRYVCSGFHRARLESLRVVGSDAVDVGQNAATEGGPALVMVS